MTKTAIANRSDAFRSRITTGAAMLQGVDGRSASARRYRDIVLALESEQAKPLTEGIRCRIRAAASLQLHAEEMTARMVNGEDVSAEDLTRAASGAARVIASLKPKDGGNRKRGGGLTSYLSTRHTAQQVEPV